MGSKLARSQRSASPQAEASMLRVGDLLANKYRIQEVRGEGGMGVVAAAYHELLDQHVAIKLHYQEVADEEAQTRLLFEARAAAKLRSEHVARVLDVDVGPNGLPFIVMELLEGADLSRVADARGALPPWMVADYMLQALDGLAHAHVRGIIHRDLKPSNLFLAERGDGNQIIKILDFGISKTQGVDERVDHRITRGRGVLGSPPYMSPEQIRAPKTIDHRVDLWALGVSMYELLTGSMPFSGDEMQAIFADILERDPVPPRSLVPSIPAAFEAIVLRCLAKKREDRYFDAAGLASALAPHGSGAWGELPGRIQATLARGLIEDLSTGSRRVPVSSPSSPTSERLPVMPASSRRGDAELMGTSATVLRFPGGIEARRQWIFAAIALPAIIGVVLIALTVTRKSEPAFAADPGPPPIVEAPAAAPAPPPVVEVPPMPSASVAKPKLAPSGAAAVRRPGKPARPLPPDLPQTRSGQ